MAGGGLSFADKLTGGYFGLSETANSYFDTEGYRNSTSYLVSEGAGYVASEAVWALGTAGAASAARAGYTGAKIANVGLTGYEGYQTVMSGVDAYSAASAGDYWSAGLNAFSAFAGGAGVLSGGPQAFNDLGDTAQALKKLQVSFDPSTLSMGGLGGVKIKIHGNSHASPKTAFLYRLEDDQGDLLKWGVTQDLSKRYTKSFLIGKEIKPVASGTRIEMIHMERGFVETQPGPLNLEPWAGANKGAQR